MPRLLRRGKCLAGGIELNLEVAVVIADRLGHGACRGSSHAGAGNLRRVDRPRQLAGGLPLFLRHDAGAPALPLRGTDFDHQLTLKYSAAKKYCLARKFQPLYAYF